MVEGGGGLGLGLGLGLGGRRVWEEEGGGGIGECDDEV